MDEHYSPIRRECHGECVALDAICGYLFILHCLVSIQPAKSIYYSIFKDPFAASQHSWTMSHGTVFPPCTKNTWEFSILDQQILIYGKNPLYSKLQHPILCYSIPMFSFSCGITQCLEDTSPMFHNALDSSGSCAVGQCLEDGECRACKSTR